MSRTPHTIRRRTLMTTAMSAAVLAGAGSVAPAIAKTEAEAEVPQRGTRAATVAREKATVVEEKRVGRRLVDLTIQSPALGGKGEVRLLTPDGWDRRRPGQRWPVLYLLAGGDGDHLTFTRDYHVQDNPRLRDTLVVMPNMPFFGFYSEADLGRPGEAAPHLGRERSLLSRRQPQGHPRLHLRRGRHQGPARPARRRTRRGDPGPGAPQRALPARGDLADRGDHGRRVARGGVQLKQAGVPVTTHFTRGTHSPAYWKDELTRSLPMLLKAL